MRNIILVSILSFFVSSFMAAQCSYKLYDVLREQGHTFTSYSEFCTVADSVGLALGLTHTKGAQRNIEIIAAICGRTTTVVTSIETAKAPIQEARSIDTVYITCPEQPALKPLVDLSVMDRPSLFQDVTNIETSFIDSLTAGAVDMDELCECDLTGDIPQLWGRYMSLAPQRMVDSLGIRFVDLNKSERIALADCRYALGKLCRPYHAVKGIETTEAVAPPAKVKSSSSRKGSGLAALRAKDFFRSVGRFFKQIGACRRH